MQIWKWLVILALLFLITYNPSTRTMSKYFDESTVETENVYISARPSREAQSNSGPGDDDR
jgi:hypothetical protein